MSVMIERVAKAIYEADDAWSVAFPWPNPSERQTSADEYRRIARAAINAMREPTEVQLEAAEDIVVGFDDFACGDGNIYLGIPGYPQKARDVWAALVDAALKETA